jgi:hypothetical protein
VSKILKITNMWTGLFEVLLCSALIVAQAAAAAAARENSKAMSAA